MTTSGPRFLVLISAVLAGAVLGGCAIEELSDGGGGACMANTSATGTVSARGCALLERDTSACRSSRIAQGLSGFWLRFSCNVTITKSGGTVTLVSEGTPDHPSGYWNPGHACYEDFSTSGGYHKNPNSIGTQNITMNVPYTPAEKNPKSQTTGGTVGLAVNGVSIFNNAAAPQDNIFDEVYTFDTCEGHPAGTKYHYHIEPPAISNNDSNLIGVLRDGFPVYGKKCVGGSTPTLDDYGGHTGPLPGDTDVAMYHLHLQLVSGDTTDGQDVDAYFIATDEYFGTPGTCTGCL